MNIKIFAVVLAFGLLLSVGYLTLNKSDNANPPVVTPTTPEVVDTINPADETPLHIWGEQNANRSELNAEQAKLLADLKTAADKEDYTKFATTLKEAYKQLLDTHIEFMRVESALYMLATTEYFDKGNYAKSLEVSTAVYKEVSQSWRFRYLRIRTLEKFGRDAFDGGDLTKAEGYAMQILQMMYRIEGANLLADIYIKKIEANITAKDRVSAENNIGYIWDYEVSQDRRDKLTALKAEIAKL